MNEHSCTLEHEYSPRIGAGRLARASKYAAFSPFADVQPLKSAPDKRNYADARGFAANCPSFPALSARRSFSNVFQSFQSERVPVGEDEIQRAKWCTSDRRVSYVGILELRQFPLRTTWFDGKLYLKFFLGILFRYFARIAREIVGQTLPGRAISSFSRLTVRPWTFPHFFLKARKCTELAWHVRT